jgi:hypothetical protein
VKTANANGALMGRRFPQRPPIRAVTANVSDLAVPSGKVVVFMFNPFGADLMTVLLSKLEEGLSGGTIEHLFVVYDNPVCGEVFDGSRYLKRWFARMFAYDHHELGFGPEVQEGVVIWQSLRGARPDAFADHDRPITTKDSFSAAIE